MLCKQGAETFVDIVEFDNCIEKRHQIERNLSKSKLLRINKRFATC